MIIDLETYELLGVFSYSERVEDSWYRERHYQLVKERVRGADRRADPAQRPILQARQRECVRKKLARIYADPEAKEKYLSRRRELSAKYRAQETPAKREARLAKAREYMRRKAQRTSHHSTEQATP